MNRPMFDHAASAVRIRDEALRFLADLPGSYVVGDVEFFGAGGDTHIELRDALVIDLVEGVQNGTLCPAEVTEFLIDRDLTRPFDGDQVDGLTDVVDR